MSNSIMFNAYSTFNKSFNVQWVILGFNTPGYEVNSPQNNEDDEMVLLSSLITKIML